MNHTPERPINPPEATVPHSPDPDDMEFYYIDKHVLQIGTLSERTQQARNDFKLERGDSDIQDSLLGEWLKNDAENQQIVSGISNKIISIAKNLGKQAY